MGYVQTLLESNDSKTIGELINFVASEFSLENVGFLLAVHQYRALCPGSALPSIKAKTFVNHQMLWKHKMLVPPSSWGGANTIGGWIYNKYIPATAETQINISGSVKTALDAIGTARSTPFIPANFDAAFNEIDNLITRDTKRRFLAAPKP